MTQGTILHIEDDSDIVELVDYNLKLAGFNVVSAMTGEAGFAAAMANPPDLVLLDIMLPETDGLRICRRLKSHAETSIIPIIMVTAKGEEGDVTRGLSYGADDYVVKPFRPAELVARVSATLRNARLRSESDARDSVIEVGGISINQKRRRVTVRGENVSLSTGEYSLLKRLAFNRGKILTSGDLSDGGSGAEQGSDDVSEKFVSLRAKLQSEAGRLVSVQGLGYLCIA